jgi:hypothetical protein
MSETGEQAPKIDLRKECPETSGTLQKYVLSPNFETFKEPKNRFQGTNPARLCSLAGHYDSPIPTQFIVPIDCLKIPAQNCRCSLEKSLKKLMLFKMDCLASVHRISSSFGSWNKSWLIS